VQAFAGNTQPIWSIPRFGKAAAKVSQAKKFSQLSGFQNMICFDSVNPRSPPDANVTADQREWSQRRFPAIQMLKESRGDGSGHGEVD